MFIIEFSNQSMIKPQKKSLIDFKHRFKHVTQNFNSMLIHFIEKKFLCLSCAVLSENQILLKAA